MLVYVCVCLSVCVCAYNKSSTFFTDEMCFYDGSEGGVIQESCRTAEKESGKMPLAVFRKLTTCERQRALAAFVAFSFHLLCLFERAVIAYVVTAAPLAVPTKFL